MSAGVFSRSKYQSDGGAIWPVKVQPETLNLSVTSGNGSVTNSPPDGAISGDVPSAIVGGSRRRYGVHTRGLRLKFTGTPPTGYKPDSPIFVPVLKKETYDAIARNSTGTYLGVAIQVIGKVGEAIK